jgi:SAM-dependent methyltransferase
MKKEIKEPLDKEELNQLAQQLRCPNGEQGITVGELLDDTNKRMILESIKSLEIKNKHRILELGYGNGSHLPEILKQANNVKYFGMEISKVMQQQAAKINAKYVKKLMASFQMYDGQNVPYVLNFFDRILTVNTIYFWNNPTSFLNEIHRVLKPNGIFVVSFAKRSFMKKLPFVSQTNVFNLYDNSTLEHLVANTQFELLDIKDKKESVKSKTGDWVDREYTIAVLRKKQIPKHSTK